MLSYIEKHDLLSNTQFGFRQNLSTEAALLKLTDFVHKGLTLKQNVGTIFMDLSKAFDSMNHDILESKLEHYGFRGNVLKFLMSFVRNTTYFVNVNGLNSDKIIINNGIAQGSILGPIFFILFINDMKACSILLKFIQFADDTTLMFSSNSFMHLQNTLESEAIKVTEWLERNRLVLNLSKTNLMLFSYKRNNPKLSIKINDIEIAEKSETTFLGVQLDNKLTWKSHVTHICSKISKSLAILRLVKSIFPKNVMKTIYMSLIYSYVNYCNLIWGAAAYGIIKPIFLLQKKAIRILTNSTYLAHTEPLFKKLKLLTVYQVYDLNCAQFIYKCIKCNMFSEYRERIHINTDIHDHNTRRKTFRVNTRARLDICKYSCLHYGIHIWNILNSELKSFNSLGYFKKKLKCHMLGQ